MNAGFKVQETPSARILQPSGDWTVLQLEKEVDRLGTAARKGLADRLDLSQLGRVDTTGAFVLLQALKSTGTLTSSNPDFDKLSDLVRVAAQAGGSTATASRRVPLFERIGKAVIAAATEAYSALAFSGELVEAFARTALHPRRLRLTPLFAVMEQAGIDSIPIVMMMTFFIGAILALVGDSILTTFGVAVYVVELVGVATLREFGVVVAAILLAGRSASAFAAEIGSMRMNQETDAMQVMGVDRFDAIIVPRVLGALLMMPLMTFCADIGGMIGGMLVCWATLGMNPVFFAQRTLETVTPTEFWLGMVKSPVMAIIVAAAGCRHGLSVSGDVTSLGRAVTRAVVQSIFLIIMFDAIFAAIFNVLNL